MSFLETFKLALSAVWGNKLRSVLTLIGMIIGVTAVVVIVSLIQGFNTYFDEKIARVGSKSFNVQRFNFEDFKDQDSIAAAMRRNKELTLADMEYLRQNATLIDKIGAKARSTSSQISAGTNTLQDIRVDGATPVIGEIEAIDINEGRYFTDIENDSASRIAFVGSDIADKLFPYGSAVGQELQIRGLPYRVIGVQVEKGAIFGMPQDSFITLPLKTYGKDFGGLIGRRSVYFVATARSDELYKDAVDETRTLMRIRRRQQATDKDSFGMFTADAIMGMRDRVLGSFFIVAVAVPGIALVVGAIVIMNIMLVSVTERTKEIGVRKALGARRSDILKQFLVEAVTLSSIGGAVGVILAWIIGMIVSHFIFTTNLSISAVIMAVGVSGGVGVIAGIFPAWKAARLDPIEALRAD